FYNHAEATDQTKTVAEAITEIVTAESNNQTKANIQIKADNNLLPIESQYFQKIVQELLNNALKFSAPDSLIRLNSKIKNNNLYFIISDHGRGMTAQQIAKIGAHTQFARNIYEQQGSGLGLAITKEIVNLYQGELAIKSILNEGTIIKIVIPLSTSDQHNCLRQKQAKVSKITQA
ncbi:MAG: ATP-binding protein, partial [Cyanobacteria bacterium J083]